MVRVLVGLAAIGVGALFGELAARLDDWIFLSVPLLANPDREHDLLKHETDFIRGREHGRFKKYRLNSFGFRGPEIEKRKTPGVPRVMILGASETFGLYESEGHEYPALVAAEFARQGRNVEVINAAVAGMTLPSLTAYWNKWAKEFEPDIVVVYPSPLFYLDDERPRPAKPDPDRPGPGFRSRFLERLVDTAKQSDILREAKTLAKIARARLRPQPVDVFDGVPRDRLDAYVGDLDRLVGDVRDSGARPVVVSHAFKFDEPLDARDTRELEAFRAFFPRAEPSTMVAFESAANEAIRRLPNHPSTPTIDAAAELTGRRDLFADPVHFNDAGSRAMAERLVRELTPLLPPPSGPAEGR